MPVPTRQDKERATTREAKRTAARWVAPKMAWGFVAPQSQIAVDMLLRRASPQAILGATKHQLYARHHTSSKLTIPQPARDGRARCSAGNVLLKRKNNLSF